MIFLAGSLTPYMTSLDINTDCGCLNSGQLWQYTGGISSSTFPRHSTEFTASPSIQLTSCSISSRHQQPRWSTRQEAAQEAQDSDCPSTGSMTVFTSPIRTRYVLRRAHLLVAIATAAPVSVCVFASVKLSVVHRTYSLSRNSLMFLELNSFCTSCFYYSSQLSCSVRLLDETLATFTWNYLLLMIISIVFSLLKNIS